MCAIVGAYLESPDEQQIETLKVLFVESQIRGKHQTGFAMRIWGNRIWRQTVDGSAERLVNEFDWSLPRSAPILELAGHCRYSTSDMRYPQPIKIHDRLALCHNGVVDQRSPEHWAEYGYDLATANDSELLYRAADAEKQPLLEFPTASMAVCEVHGERGMRWYRNGKRPLYYSKVPNGYFICSTKDIGQRSGLKNIRRCVPGIIYTPTGSTKLSTMQELIP